MARRARGRAAPAVNPTRLDRAIGKLFPRWGYERARYRLAEAGLDQIHQRFAQPINPYAVTSYRHANYTRLQRARSGLSGSGDTLLDVTTREAMIRHSQDLDRNNAVAHGMFDRRVDNVIGTGMSPQARSGDTDWNEKAEQYFNDWAEHAGVRGEAFWQLQRMAVRSKDRDGDVGLILAGKKLQPIEAEQIVTPTGAYSNPNVVQGVEMDKYGRPVQYWIAQHHPIGRWVNKQDCVAVDAGDFIHYFDPERVSQSRGCPALGPCLGYFDILDQYIEAELVGALVASCLTAFFVGEQKAEHLAVHGESVENAAGEEHKAYDMEPGLIYDLTGTGAADVKVVNPNKPAQQFPEFITALLRIIGLPLGLPLELIALDFQKGSYSSARLALLQAYRTFHVEQKLLEYQICRRVWRWKIDQGIKYDNLGYPSTGEKERYWHIWQPQKQDWIDPLAEAQANAIALDRGMKTLTDIAKEWGQDTRDMIWTRAMEIAEAKKAAEANGIDDWHDILRADTRMPV